MASLHALMPHLVVAPVLVPLLAAALILIRGESSSHRRSQSVLSVLGLVANLAVAAALVEWSRIDGVDPSQGVFLSANWAAPFGIVLVADPLSVSMLLVTAVVALAALVYSLARWHRAGVHFHALLQIQVMGLNGAFLTGDLFNLFVFFEVMLAASYGLLLHGSGRDRVGSGLHYIAVNLIASTLFLVGVAIVYGVTGTLNMADIAHKLAQIPASDRTLFQAGAGILAVAFLIKAAMWPLGFWLVPAYSAASAPVAGLFAIMTKVGLYAVLRLWTLAFPAGGEVGPLFGADWLVWGGLATMTVGSFGFLGSLRLARTAGWAVVVSSGTTLVAFGLGGVAMTTAGVYYLISSVLATSALLLIVEAVERSRAGVAVVPRTGDEGDPFPSFFEMPEWQGQFEPVNLDDDEQALVGRPLQRSLVFLGLGFIACALLVAGLPPLSGFVAKVMMMEAALRPAGLAATPATVPVAGWFFVALLAISGFAAMFGLTRLGVRILWAPQGRAAPRLGVLEGLPVMMLVVLAVLLVLRAPPVIDQARLTAEWLYQPQRYVEAVLSARPVPARATAGEAK
jgi:multicomponent K+:H+ antiporter subunit D